MWLFRPMLDGTSAKVNPGQRDLCLVALFNADSYGARSRLVLQGKGQRILTSGPCISSALVADAGTAANAFLFERHRRASDHSMASTRRIGAFARESQLKQ